MHKRTEVVVERTPVLGLWLASTKLLPDPERGKLFGIPFQADVMPQLDFGIQQINFSVTVPHGTTGGWHVEPLSSKMIFLTGGHVYNPVLCLDPNSPDFLSLEQIWLKPGMTLVVPPLYGNGFQTHKLVPDDIATYVYARSLVHRPEDDWAVSIKKDPETNGRWPEDPVNMSARDESGMTIAEYLAKLAERLKA